MRLWALRFLHNIFLPIISLLEKSPANLITTITLFSEIIFFLNPKKSPNIFLCHISLFWLCLSFHCPPVCVFLGCVFLVEEMFDFSYYNSIFWFLILFFFVIFVVFVMDDLFSYTGPPFGSLFFLLQIWKVIARLIYKLKIHDKKKNNHTDFYPI